MQWVPTGIRCRPGKTYQIADETAMRVVRSEFNSTSGEFDLHKKIYFPDGENIGRYTDCNLLDIDGSERNVTMLTFNES